jgi:hypothetical protein
MSKLFSRGSVAVFAVAVAVSSAPARAGEAARSSACSAYLDQNLGSYVSSFTPGDAETTRLFNQGLVLTYAFMHEEAQRSFKAALGRDPTCAMCAWGLAYAQGPNINMPMPPESAKPAYLAVQSALALAQEKGVTEREKDYIAALAARYTPDEAADRGAFDHAYADAMHGLAAKYPSDPDAQALAAEADMLLSPWNYWAPDGSATALTTSILTALERALRLSPDHPGANHFYIHAVEAARPAWGKPAADKLAALVPGAGHIVHMPSHIYLRIGAYDRASDANVAAIEADARYTAVCGLWGMYAELYVPHNMAFLIASSSLEGRSRFAIEAAKQLQTYADAHLLGQASPSADAADWASAPLLTLLRFGRYADVLATVAPAANHPHAEGLWRYARVMALVRSGRVAEVDTDLAALSALAADARLDGEMLMGVNSSRALIGIAALEAQAAVAGAKGDSARAIELLKQAVESQDALRYMEPPPWYHSVRVVLGGALLRAGRAADAESVYRDDLVRFPENGWALVGLRDALLAQNRAKEARDADVRLARAWARADVSAAVDGGPLR